MNREPMLAPSPRPRVLVVDDEPAIRVALQRVLREYEVVVTSNGYEALARLARGDRFDAIVCDLVMPGMGGDELYREIQRFAPEQVDRVVFVTGGGTTESARAFLDEVPNTVVDKPFNLATLREMLRMLVGPGRR